jgi:dTDP-4-amino-4,6-dideoxygalactose transaminase
MWAGGMTDEVIRFNEPSLDGSDVAYIQNALERGHTAWSRPNAAASGDLLRESLGAPDVLPTRSCTSPLEISAMLLHMQPRDTVVVPSLTFTSTPLALAREGAQLQTGLIAGMSLARPR